MRCWWAIPAVILSLTVSSAKVHAERFTVLVKSAPDEFVPADITIQPGDVIAWTWFSGAHTVTSDDGLFDSGIHAKPWRFRVLFLEPGDYWYYCGLHGSPGGNGHAGVIRVAARAWEDEDEPPMPVPARRP
jgi:plastocyanin